jgi:hypothetical protein
MSRWLETENLKPTAGVLSSERPEVKNSNKPKFYQTGVPPVKGFIGTMKYSRLKAIFLLTRVRQI